MDVSKITAIVKLIETGHQHEEAGEQREEGRLLRGRGRDGQAEPVGEHPEAPRHGSRAARERREARAWRCEG